MALNLFDRIGTVLKADAHGIVESLEERSLVLKQYLREAELEVNRKRARLEAVREEEKRLIETVRRREDEIRALDEDVTLALGGGKDDLARFAIRRLLPRRAEVKVLGARIAERTEEARVLAERVEAQQQQLDALRTRVRAELARETSGVDTATWGGEAVVADEEVELGAHATARGRGRVVVMRLDSFGRSAAFAAVAALAWMPWFVVAAPLLGMPATRVLYLVAVTGLYAGGLAKSAPRRASVTLVVTLAGVLLAVVARGTPELCIALAAVLGLARSGFVHRTSPARAVAIEAGLLVGGLVFARFLTGTTLGTALAVWGFFLVQSCFFLLGGIAARSTDGRDPDAFEAACARAAEVLERPLG